MTEKTTQTQMFAQHQLLLMHQLEQQWGLKVEVRDDMVELVRRHAQLAQTGGVQLPFMLGRSTRTPSPHFWVCLLDGPDTVALAGLRIMANGDQAQSSADFFAGARIHPSTDVRGEDYLPGTGPRLAPGARFAYLGAAWVHPYWRGRSLAGLLARIVNDEAALRADGQLAFACAMTPESMHTAGLNLRANCWHHMQAELVLGGHTRMALSHSTMAQQAALYVRELQYLCNGLAVPWLSPHDTTPAPSLLLRDALPLSA